MSIITIKDNVVYGNAEMADRTTAAPATLADTSAWRAWVGPRPMVAMNTIVQDGKTYYPAPKGVNLTWLIHELLDEVDKLRAQAQTPPEAR
jgi:hypothetical protein